MKLLSMKYFIFLILLTSTFVSGQIDDEPERIISVNAGDSFTYVISQKLGIDGAVFSDGYNDLYLENGDTFNLTVLDSTLNTGQKISLELWNQVSNVTYENDFAFFDFVWYADWDYTVAFLESFGLDYYEDQESIHFTFFINSGGEDATYFEYSYLKETGILLHKLEYQAPINDFQNPSKRIQIDLGLTPLDRYEFGELGFNVGDYYIYEMIQLQGFEDQYVFQGKNDTLSLEAGNQFVVTPLSSEPNSVESVPISVQSLNDGILYSNKLDFQNSFANPSFFIYPNWNYIDHIVDLKDLNSNEDKTIESSTTSTKFVYKETFVNSTSYYKLELQYDLSSGVLTYESLVLENFWNVSFGIIEFQLDNTNKIDQTKFKLDLDLTYNYKLVNYEANNYEPLFRSDDGNLWLFSDDTFSITPTSQPNNNHVIEVLVDADGDTIESTNRLDLIGSYFVYTDWDFWGDLILLLDDFSTSDAGYKLTNTNGEITFSQTLNTPNLQILETMVYDETNGVLIYYAFKVTGTDLSGGVIFTEIEFELESTTPTSNIQNPGKKSNGDNGPILFLTVVVVSVMLLVTIQKKYKIIE